MGLVLDFKMSVPPTPKRKFVRRLRTWKLSDPSCSDKFGKAFCKACGNHKEVDHCKKCGIQIECSFCGAHKEPLCVACLHMETEEEKMQRKLVKEKFVVNAREQTTEEIWSRLH